MIELLVQILPLAIGAALTPSLLALQILTTGTSPWVAKATAVVLGALSAFGIAIAALLIGFAQLPHRSAGRDLVAGLVWCLAAVALIAIAIWLFWPHPHLAERLEASIAQRVDHASVGTFFALAFALSIKDVSSFVLLVPAMHDIAVAEVAWFMQPIAVVLVLVLALSPVLVPPVVRAIGGARADRALERVYRFTMAHQLQIGGAVAVVFAVYLLVIGTGPNGLDLR